MAYFTKASLKRYADQHRTEAEVRRNILRKGMTDSVRAWLFLSHSHADMETLDSDTLEGIKILLASLGFDVYIDSLDTEMPTITSATTASRIKEKIEECHKFVLVATVNAINSKWVPWELGYADSAKGVDNIALLPIADARGEWSGNEYLRLYPHIQEGNLASIADVQMPDRYTKKSLDRWASPQMIRR